jgi:hypothetical protein
MLRVYRWRGAFWRFEDGMAPDGAVLVERAADRGVTPETPRKAPAKRATRTRKPKSTE